MPPPTSLAIATQAVQRLVKEESYYHKDQTTQEARITKLEADLAAGSADLDPNAEYMLKQERTALEETKKMFEPLRERIVRSVQTLEEMLAIAQGEGTASEGEVAKANEALEAGRKVGGLDQAVVAE